MMGEQRKSKVISLVEAFIEEVSQVTSAVNDDTANCWSAVRYNANNAWYVNTSNGNVNNNNTNNRYTVLPCPLASVDLLFQLMLQAEASCFKNKHQSIAACQMHYHLSELYRYAQKVFYEGLEVGICECFLKFYPVLREIFCSIYNDRIMHHMCHPVMEFVAEVTHRNTGDVSHGNRKGHSAFTAAKAVQDVLRKVTHNWTRKAWVATRDYSGFFMSINRERAASEFRRYAEQVVDVAEPITAYLIDVTCFYLLSDPTKLCIRLSPKKMWDDVAPNKSLFSAKPGHGLPIGNFPSQIIANLYRADVDLSVAQVEGVEQVVFVDDRATCAESKELLKKVLADTEAKSEQYELVTNKRKRYMQQADKGVKFCGYVIKCDRIYISNRVVHACNRLLQEYENRTDAESEAELARSLNSYTGIMSHTRSYNIQKRIMSKTLSAHKTLYFVRKPGHLVCKQHAEYTPKWRAIERITEFNHEIHRLQARTYTTRSRRRARRRMENISNQ